SAILAFAILALAWTNAPSLGPGRPEPSASPLHAHALQSHIPVIPAPQAKTLEAFRAKIQHIVFIIKENRTFDMYFGTFPGADGATTGLISTGERMALKHASDRMPRDLGHDYEDARRAMDDGRMDRFDLVREG